MSTNTSTRTETRWIDVSVPIRDGMFHWPDNPPIRLRRLKDMDRGDAANVSELSLGVHTGTHVDAPVHFMKDAPGVDALPIDSLTGPARVVEIDHPRTISREELERKLDGAALQPGARLIFKTRNSTELWGRDAFSPDFVYLDIDAARFLVEQGVRTVAVDYLSVAGMHEGPETHGILLEANVCIIEGLDLSQVREGAYELMCLPLKLKDCDGAPARVMLRPLAG